MPTPRRSQAKPAPAKAIRQSQRPTADVPAATGDRDATGEPVVELQLEIVEVEGDWSAFGNVAGALASTAVAIAADRALAGELPAVASVALSSDQAVRALNRRWRGKDKPTNVLSFEAPRYHVAGEPRLLGDVVLAAETLLREAGEQAIAPVDHLRHLVIHGVLHLAGYDHEIDADAQLMESIETRILASLGVADPYAEPPDDGEPTTVQD